MEVLYVYLWMQLDSIGKSLFICFLSAIAFLIVSAILVTWLNDTRTNSYGELRHGYTSLVSYTTSLKPSFIAVIIFGVVFTLLPNKTTVAVMVGTHFAVAAANSPEGKKVQTLVQQYANKLLDEAIASTVPAKK